MVASANLTPKSLLPLLPSRPKAEGTQPAKSATYDLHLLRTSMSLTSWLLVGCLLQLLLTATGYLPPRVSALLILSVLGYRTGHALLITFKLIPNHHLDGVIFKHHSAQIPDLDGKFSAKPADEAVAVLHLGAKINHPLGGFAPHAQTLIKHADRMYAVLDAEAKGANGYLGGTTFMSVDAKDCTEVINISYWRSTEAIHDFAYSSAHRKGWEWWNSIPMEELKHLGINHEIFYAPKGNWETIYINHQPTLMAGTHSFRPGDKGIGGSVEDQWMSNAVDASKGPLRTSAGRLSRGKEELGERYAYYPTAINGYGEDGRVLKGEKVEAKA